MRHTKRIAALLLCLTLCFSLLPVNAEAASYSGDYRFWIQESSDYPAVRQYGCWIVAQAKMLYGMGVNRDPSFNPDLYTVWEAENGRIADVNNIAQLGDGGESPKLYASSLGKSLTYFGNDWECSTDQLWFNINAGYWTIVKTYTSLGGDHYVLIDNETSKTTGQIYFLDSSYYSSPQVFNSAIRQIYVYQYNAPAESLPEGGISKISANNGKLHIEGWALDSDTPNKNDVQLDVYIGADGYHGGRRYITYTNGVYRSSAGDYHGFNLDVTVNESGVQPVYIYAIDTWNPHANTIIYNGGTVCFTNDYASSISLNKSSMSVKKGDSEQLSVTYTPSDTINKSVTWSSSDTSVATVSSDGTVTGTGVGTANITATAVGSNVTATCSVTVLTDATLTLDKTAITVPVGTGKGVELTAALTPYSEDAVLKWQFASRSNRIVPLLEGARIDQNVSTGNMRLCTGPNATVHVVGCSSLDTLSDLIGQTIALTVSCDGATATCQVTFVAPEIPATSIAYNQDSVTLVVGEETDLIVNLLPANTTETWFKWSRNTDAFSANVNSGPWISAGGYSPTGGRSPGWDSYRCNYSEFPSLTSAKLLAKKVGTGTMTATTVNGLTATCTVTVVDTLLPTSLTLDKTALTMSSGDKEILTATVLPANATDKTVTWSSSNTSVATVSSSGEVTAAGSGSAVITASAAGGNVTATCNVTVSSVYTVTYDANGGTGAPAAQTKTHGTALTLSSEKPTRADESTGNYTVTLDANGSSVNPATLSAAVTTKYAFQNWNTEPDGTGADYKPGAKYTSNDNLVLYAQWTESTTTAAVTLPTPMRDGYTFKGWGTSADATSGVTGNYTPTGNVTLYAVWEENSSQQDRFTDVPEDSWYSDAVYWAKENGITTGTTPTTFSPNAACTRAQIVTFLWRVKGEPEPRSYANPFRDVPSDKFYYKAVLWAYHAGITTGTSETTFGPNAVCTRAQSVTFLWRTAGSPNVAVGTKFKDVKSDAFYAKAVYWAYNNGITTGTSSTAFSPNTACSRAQIVTFLYRYAG